MILQLHKRNTYLKKKYGQNKHQLQENYGFVNQSNLIGSDSDLNADLDVNSNLIYSYLCENLQSLLSQRKLYPSSVLTSKKKFVKQLLQAPFSYTFNNTKVEISTNLLLDNFKVLLDEDNPFQIKPEKSTLIGQNERALASFLIDLEAKLTDHFNYLDVASDNAVLVMILLT